MQEHNLNSHQYCIVVRDVIRPYRTCTPWGRDDIVIISPSNYHGNKDKWDMCKGIILQGWHNYHSMNIPVPSDYIVHVANFISNLVFLFPSAL